MTLKQMVYFLKIAETENLTKAAELLNVSQPPLSYQLKTLEEELGVSLFIREPRRLVITEEGRFLKERVEKIIKDVDKMIEDMGKFAERRRNVINIGVVSSVNANILPQTLDEFCKMHRDVVVNVYDGSSSHVLHLIEKGMIDVGILREPFDTEMYESKRLCIAGAENDYFVAVGQREIFEGNLEQDITLNKLGDYPLIIHRRFEESLKKKFTEKGIIPNIVVRNDNTLTSIECVKHGFGVAIMPLSSSRICNDSDILVKKIVDPVSYSNLYAIWERDENRIIRSFVEIL